jgi:hypothetical protein
MPRGRGTTARGGIVDRILRLQPDVDDDAAEAAARPFARRVSHDLGPASALMMHERPDIDLVARVHAALTAQVHAATEGAAHT